MRCIDAKLHGRGERERFPVGDESASPWQPLALGGRGVPVPRETRTLRLCLNLNLNLPGAAGATAVAAAIDSPKPDAQLVPNYHYADVRLYTDIFLRC